MSEPNSVSVRARLLAEFIDEGDPAPGDGPPRTEVQRPVLFGPFIDDGGPEATLPIRRFVVEFLDHRQIHVRGHGIECGPGELRQVVLYSAGRRVSVAAFQAPLLLGIYEAFVVAAASNGDTPA